MGRIKTLLIKRVTRQIMKLHDGEFSEEFDKNKEIVNKMIIEPPKKMRNTIAGYVTRLVKREKKHQI